MNNVLFAFCVLGGLGIVFGLVLAVASKVFHVKEDPRIAGPLRPTLTESVYTLLLLMAATAIGLIFTRFGFSEANIITIFILGVLVISVVTISPIYSVVGSLLSVLLFNWFFIDPKFSFMRLARVPVIKEEMSMMAKVTAYSAS